MSFALKRIRKSKYKYVSLYEQADGKEVWKVNAYGVSQYHEDERIAAIEADKLLIRLGKKPVNILKSKGVKLKS